MALILIIRLIRHLLSLITAIYSFFIIKIIASTIHLHNFIKLFIFVLIFIIQVLLLHFSLIDFFFVDFIA
jgi:hypothetical protein